MHTETTAGIPMKPSIFKFSKKKRLSRVAKNISRLEHAKEKLSTWQDDTFTIKLESKLYGKEIHVGLNAKAVLPFVKPLLKAQDIVSRDLERRKILNKIL